jgi:hypothetical protein
MDGQADHVRGQQGAGEYGQERGAAEGPDRQREGDADQAIPDHGVDEIAQCRRAPAAEGGDQFERVRASVHCHGVFLSR